MIEKENKHWLQSKALWLAVVTVAIGAAGMFGITGLEAEKEPLVDVLVGMAQAVAGFLLVLDRIFSKHTKLRSFKKSDWHQGNKGAN